MEVDGSVSLEEVVMVVVVVLVSVVGNGGEAGAVAEEEGSTPPPPPPPRGGEELTATVDDVASPGKETVIDVVIDPLPELVELADIVTGPMQ